MHISIKTINTHAGRSLNMCSPSVFTHDESKTRMFNRTGVTDTAVGSMHGQDTGVSRMTHIITVTSHERHGVSNHRQLDCFFSTAYHYSDTEWLHMSIMASQITGNSTVFSTACTAWQQKLHQGSTSLALCEGNPPVKGGFPSQRASGVVSVFISGQQYASALRDDSQTISHKLNHMHAHFLIGYYDNS